MKALLWTLAIVGFIVGGTWTLVAACALVALGAYYLGEQNATEKFDEQRAEITADAYLHGWSVGYDTAVDVVKDTKRDALTSSLGVIAAQADVRKDEAKSVLEAVFGKLDAKTNVVSVDFGGRS